MEADAYPVDSFQLYEKYLIFLRNGISNWYGKE